MGGNGTIARDGVTMTSEPQQNNSPPSCPPGARGRKSWLLWLGILVFIVIFFYASRSASAPASFVWAKSLEAGLARASETNRPILVKFHATWCGPCQVMDRTVFSEDEVAQALANWVPVSIDVDRDSKTADAYGIQGIPAFVVLTPKGEPLTRRDGSMSAEAFIHFIGLAENALMMKRD